MHYSSRFQAVIMIFSKHYLTNAKMKHNKLFNNEHYRSKVPTQSYLNNGQLTYSILT